MSFAPILTGSGIPAWTLLQKTRTKQTAILSAQPELQREAAYFRERIGKIDTAEALVNDRRLLKVALEAFGLESDLNNRFFIRKVLAEGTLRTDALATKLSDKRYAQFSAAFGFGDFKTPRSKDSAFADTILAQWRERRFETAVGAQDNTLRLAMNAQREIAALAGRNVTDRTQWFTLMGNPPLRSVVQTALGLPARVAALDLDQQLSIFRSRTEAVFGDDSLRQFTDPARREALIGNYLLRSQIETASATAPALTLLGGLDRRV